MNFCFILSMLFEDRYNVVTTTDMTLLASSMGDYSADLVLVDSNPTDSLLLQFQNLRSRSARFPIILLYVYSPKTVHLDKIVRNYVDAVFYKPFEIDAVSKRIAELLQS
jgi:DNA-binding response OmpR family regulator